MEIFILSEGLCNTNREVQEKRRGKENRKRIDDEHTVTMSDYDVASLKKKELMTSLLELDLS